MFGFGKANQRHIAASIMNHLHTYNDRYRMADMETLRREMPKHLPEGHFEIRDTEATIAPLDLKDFQFLIEDIAHRDEVTKMSIAVFGRGTYRGFCLTEQSPGTWMCYADSPLYAVSSDAKKLVTVLCTEFGVERSVV